MEIKDKILEFIVNSYMRSSGFNGTRYSEIEKIIDPQECNLVIGLKSLIADGLIDITCDKFHPNPYIKAFSSISSQNQLIAFAETGPLDCLYYPSILGCKGKRLGKKFQDKPYEKLLAMGWGQLDYLTFDLTVLETYLNDPRYSIQTDGINGNISALYDENSSNNLPDCDQISLQTFGYAFDDDYNRYVAVYVRYLSDLTPRHQSIWKSKQTAERHKLHPDYYDNSILGKWGSALSIYDALFMELKLINKMSFFINGKSIFRNDFDGIRPGDFIFLLRPTLKEYNGFVHYLDKITTENINKDFFHGLIETESEIVRKDGRVQINSKGTIQILSEWIEKSFKSNDNGPIDRMISSLRDVRKQRQKPAHATEVNVYDVKFIAMQRELMNKVYGSIRILRLILANHPGVKSGKFEINDYLFKGKIWPF